MESVSRMYFNDSYNSRAILSFENTCPLIRIVPFSPDNSPSSLDKAFTRLAWERTENRSALNAGIYAMRPNNVMPQNKSIP